jgi:hypothetical protein
LVLAAHLRDPDLVQRLRNAGADVATPSRKKFKHIPRNATALDFADGVPEIERVLR